MPMTETKLHTPGDGPSRSARCTRLAPLLGAVMIAMLAACGDLTKVEAPDLVQPKALDDSAGAIARRAGAIAQFAHAFVLQVSQTGLVSDEFTDAAGAFIVDRRMIAKGNNAYPFQDLSLARIDALRAISSLEAFSPSPANRIGELFALVGFSEVMLVENLCTPIPIASVQRDLPETPTSVTRDSLLEHALAMFDSALVHTAPSDTVRYLAQLGRGRALLSLDRLDEAEASVEGVPSTFHYDVPYTASISTQTNMLYRDLAMRRSLSVGDAEGLSGITFVSGSDARIGAQLQGQSSLGQPVYNFARNTGLGASIPLALGVQAILIRAEAALRRGDIPQWAAALNEARASAIAPPIQPLSADSSTEASGAERIDILFRERALWLFATGQRHGDLRRLVRQYGRDQMSVFPSGPYQGTGILYGSDVTFVPLGEEPNAGFTGCTDRSA
ncbi:MAG TPA: hypothetical protein VIQ74_01180 [Gemmatimonadaceae bacterium]